MPTSNATGIVIRKQKYNDYDLIVNLLTNEGVIGIIALGVRKITSKNRVSLELGNLIEIEFFKARLNGKLSKLKKARLLAKLPIDKSDTSFVVMKISELLNKERELSPIIFNKYIEVYKYFGDEYNHHIITYMYWHLLKSKGIAPITTKCVECNRKDNINGFTLYGGGFTCNLHTKRKMNLKKLKAYESINKKFVNFKDVDPKTSDEIGDEIITYIKENEF